tara:strand:+ start:315 stop:584 length:270 start_codon:yes stop_codon:yes gene_type:complete
LGLPFFGLNPEHRANIFREVHDLVFHGGGGFIHSEVYEMPIWLRKYHIKIINDHFKEQEKAMKKAENKNPTSEISKPNINPTSTYNIKR